MSKVRVGILGCGGMAGGHALRFKKNPDVEIVALCDVSEQVVVRFIEKNLTDYPTRPQVFTELEQFFAQAGLDAVAIVTPHTLHFAHGMQAIQAGCHVLMEKPMVTDAEQARELAAAVKKAGKILTIGYNTPCTPEFKYLRDLIRSKELGRLETVTGWQTQEWMRATVGTWRQKPELSGGGQMYDSGAHIFNSLVWTVEQPISEVYAFIDHHGAPVDVNGAVNIRFAGGVLATITISGNCPNDGSGMYYAFENGRVDVDGWYGRWIKVFKRDSGEVKYPPIMGAPQTSNDNFIDAILCRAEPRTSPQNGVHQSELMDAIYLSARTGQVARPKPA